MSPAENPNEFPAKLSTSANKKRKILSYSDPVDEKTNELVRQFEPEKRLSENSICSKVVQSTESFHTQSQPIPTTSLNSIESRIEYVKVCNRELIKLGVLGKGGSSTVYRLISPTTGALYAHKLIHIKESSSSSGYAKELDILNSLRESTYVIDLLDFRVDEKQISMLMELGEIDLSKVLSQRAKSSIGSSNMATLVCPFFSRMIWKDMLEAVDFLHKNKIIHGDLKPANFVFVRNRLKLIDFGIATRLSEDGFAYRDSQIGTINYMAPEAILPVEKDKPMRSADGKSDMKIRVGPPSDVWSLGCILYQIIYGKPPFSHLSTLQKLQSIPNPKFQIAYGDIDDYSAVESIKVCLVRDEQSRITISGGTGLLKMRYLTFPTSILKREPLRSLNLASNTENHTNETKTNRKSLSKSLKVQIEEKPKLESSAQHDKWMKVKGEDSEKTDIRSILEKRIGEMRKFLDEEDQSLDEFSESTI